MTILVQVPRTFVDERAYIWTVLIQEFLGFSLSLQPCDQAVTTLSVPGVAGRVVIPDGFFAMPDGYWLTSASLPARPTARLGVPAECGRTAPGLFDIVSLYGHSRLGGPAVRFESGAASVEFDLSGSAFYMLTRYEEAVGGELDEHGRFPTSAMVATKDNFSDRPVVNEYVELLHACLTHVWPGLARVGRTFSTALSHDVDSVAFHKGAGPRQLASSVAGDLIQRRDPGLAVRRIRSFVSTGEDRFERDPYNTFDLLMDASERHGVRSAFYFITGGDTPRDANYLIEEPLVQRVLGRIVSRGHEIGLHPSYGTPADGGAIRAEFRALREAAVGAGSAQVRWGGRQHYLRWNAAETWGHWADAGLDYDSSVGFPDRPGFRAGCCYEYSTYDLVGRRRLTLIERPLIVMEKTAFGSCSTLSEARDGIDKCERLAAIVKRFSGCFSLLWHNSKIVSKVQRRTYLELLGAIS